MKRPRLSAVKPLAGFRLVLVFINGKRHVLDMRDDVSRLPGLAPLQDEDAWLGAIVDENGWVVEWPELDIQIGADTLWMDAQAQAAKDPDTREFILWRAKNGLSLADAARALGITPRTVSAYGTGERPVPRYIILACKGWELINGRVAA